MRYALLLIFGLFTPLTFAETAKYADFTLDYSYAMWKPSDIESADTATVGKNILRATLDVSPVLPFLGEFQYWRTPEDRVNQKALLEEEKYDSAFEKIAGNLRIPTESGALYTRYEKVAFTGTATLNESNEYVAFNRAPQQLNANDEVSFLTVFETYHLGGLWLTREGGQIGAAYEKIAYERPFTIKVKGEVIDPRIYDGKFEGEAFVLWGKSPYFMLKQEGNMTTYGAFKGSVSWGLNGDIRFANDLSLDNELGESTAVGYFRVRTGAEAKTMIGKHVGCSFGVEYDEILFVSGEEGEDGSRSFESDGALDIAAETLLFVYVGLNITI